MKILTSLALIDPAVLPALRMAGTVFLMINLIGGAYIFLNRHRFFDRNPNVTNDVAAVRHLSVEVVLVPWLARWLARANRNKRGSASAASCRRRLP